MWTLLRCPQVPSGALLGCIKSWGFPLAREIITLLLVLDCVWMKRGNPRRSHKALCGTQKELTTQLCSQGTRLCDPRVRLQSPCRAELRKVESKGTLSCPSILDSLSLVEMPGSQQLLSPAPLLASPAPGPHHLASSLWTLGFLPPSWASAGLSRVVTSFLPGPLTICVTKPDNRTSTFSHKRLWLLDNERAQCSAFHMLTEASHSNSPGMGRRETLSVYGKATGGPRGSYFVAKRCPRTLRKSKYPTLLTYFVNGHFPFGFSV